MTASDGFRLSPVQRYLWAKQQHAQAHRYGARCCVGIDGPLDRGALQAALAAIVERHEILRTRFVERAGLRVPIQAIHDTAEVAIEYADCTHLDADACLAAVDLASRDVDRAPRHGAAALRAHCLRFAPDRHTLILGAPGLCADATTLRFVVTELAERYHASSRALQVTLPEPPQYADLSEWLNLLLESPDFEAARQWWERQGRFVASRSRPHADTPPAMLDVPLPGGAADTLSRPRLLACAQVLAWRLTGDPASCIGVGVDGRASPQLTQALGPLERYVPVHGSIERELPFHALLERADAAIRACETRAHFLDFPEAHFAWPIAVDAAAATAACAGPTAFVLQSAAACWDRARVRLSGTGDGPAALRLEYDPASVTTAEAYRWRERLQTILERTAESPDVPVGALDVLGPDERRTIAQWNLPARAAPDGCIPDAFERTAADEPGRIAVVCDDASLTYGELQAWAHHVAAELQRRGVAPDDVVALRSGRSPELVAGILGILESGAAYLPLDPHLPARRAAYQLHDCGVRLMLVAPGLDDDVPGWSGDRVVLDRAGVDGQPRQAPRRRPQSRHLAYVIYTSGSTGHPKGVAVEHRHVVHYVRAVRERHAVPSKASFATVSSFAMDLGNTAIYLSLATGGTLHPISSARASDPAAFGEYMRRHGVDVLKIVPSHLETLLAVDDPAGSLPRRMLILGGETPGAPLVARLTELRPDLTIVNHYGPTETTIGAATYQVPPGVWPGSTPPIGRPLPDTSIHILDERLRPVPIGAAGELHIGGAGVARGYVNLPALTAERFVTGSTGERMYRTGDRGRYLEDGHIEFLGRADAQLKIRGFRIEPAEVEAAIREAEGVRQAVVLGVPENAPAHLAAYIVADSPGAWRRDRARVEGLRASLSAWLPEHMIPLEIVALDAFPLTPNGKIDRHGLPAAGPGARVASEPPAPPADALELQLQTIWEELLNVRPIGVIDSFFELGGHSLMAVRLLARVRTEIDPGVALTTLLHAPTIRQLASALRGGGSWRPSPLVPLQPRGAAPPFFCVHGGWGDVLCYGRLARRLGEDQPLYGLQAIEHAPVSVGQLAGLNLEAIRAVQPHGPYRIGGWSFGGVVAYDMACQLRARGEEVESLVLIDAVPPGAPPWNFAAVLATMNEQLERVPWLFGTDHGSSAEGARWLSEAARRARLHHEALQAYSPPPCDVRSLLVRAGEGLDPSPYDPLEAWRPFLSVAPDVRHAGGNHFNMLEEPHVASVALAVREFFALTGSPPGQVAG